MGLLGKLQRPLRFQNNNLFLDLSIIDDFKAIFVGMTHVKVDSPKVTKISFLTKTSNFGLVGFIRNSKSKDWSKRISKFLSLLNLAFFCDFHFHISYPHKEKYNYTNI